MILESSQLSLILEKSSNSSRLSWSFASSICYLDRSEVNARRRRQEVKERNRGIDILTITIIVHNDLQALWPHPDMDTHGRRMACMSVKCENLIRAESCTELRRWDGLRPTL
ncbi:hypothetical protein RRG08_031889 [Elysia crispata]|uniref:Uncharacterized protein n=1 Tax=Elysia crispata TaxID=231223 RepID=A0AAE1AGV9_9GAST|nr:hypothetical protein RRG08_031889 [Elysia crispata]